MAMEFSEAMDFTGCKEDEGLVSVVKGVLF